VPDAIIVDGVVEGDVTAQSIRIGPSGAIKGKVVSTDIDVSGTLAEKADIKEFLLVRSSGRVEGHVNCGDVQVERGAVLAGGIFSVYSAAAEVKPVNDNQPANAPELDAPAASDQRPKIDAAEEALAAGGLLAKSPLIRASELAAASPGESVRRARAKFARPR
jgi:cytoskeletal protein CcmA (bactofilin family)